MTDRHVIGSFPRAIWLIRTTLGADSGPSNPAASTAAT